MGGASIHSRILAQRQVDGAMMETAILDELELMVVLLNVGADVYVKREDDITGLPLAAHHGLGQIVDALLTHGADSTGREKRFDGNAAGWEQAGGHDKRAEPLAGALNSGG